MNAWAPVGETERYRSIDILRGLSLFGVLLVNLLDFFRVSLFEHILNFHTDPAWTNRLVDVMVATLLEFKAFDLFSFTFGVGVAIQTERAMLRGIHVSSFLTRRFLVLLVFGMCHLILISNVDILTLYAVCGLMLIPVRRLPASALAVLGVIALSNVFLPSGHCHRTRSFVCTLRKQLGSIAKERSYRFLRSDGGRHA